MPKVKRCYEVPSNELRKKQKVEEAEIYTDLSKSFNENVENRFQHWEKVEKEIQGYEKNIQHLKQLIKNVPDTPENRPMLSDYRAQIEELENKIRRLKRANDPIEYLYCVANVIRDSESGTIKLEKDNLETIRVNASGPLKPRLKKKKLPNQHCNDGNTFSVKPITAQLSQITNSFGNEVFAGMVSEKTKSAKKLAQALHELPLETSDIEYCPTCISVILQFNERPPSMYCPQCGLSVEVLDNTSAAVHDKETTTHLPFTYRPKLHFISWVKRITGKLKFTILSWVTDEIYFRLYQRKITDVNLVTWEIIDDIVRTAAKTDKRFADYYPHVYQLTNIIRGRPILVFTEEEEQEIFE